MNFVCKMRVLASVIGVFLNEYSDGRILLASPKGLFTLQRESFDPLIRALSLGHKALMEDSLGSNGGVIRPLWECHKALVAKQGGFLRVSVSFICPFSGIFFTN